MRCLKIVLLFLLSVCFVSDTFSQANASLNILSLNGGQIAQGGIGVIQVTVGNTGPGSINANKVRAQLSIPSIAASAATVDQIGLPPGWTITVNTTTVPSSITVCNGSDVIAAGTNRQIFIRLNGLSTGGPSTVSGGLLFSNGTSCTVPGSLTGDNTADNTSTTSITVVPSPACTLTGVTATGSMACNGSTGTITVIQTGAAGSVEYSLNGGTFQSSNTLTVPAPAASKHFIMAREAANPACVQITAVTLTNPPAITASASVTTTIPTPGGTGSITVTAGGGTGALSYVIATGTTINTTGAASGVFTGLLAGSYTFTVTDANNCSITTAPPVLLEDPVVTCNLSVSATAGTIACNAGTTTLTATASGAADAVEYSLNGGAFQSSNTFTVSAGTHTITAREVNNTSCSATSNTVTVTNPAAITASASAGNILCNGGTTTLTVTASGGTGALQYSLNGGAFQAGNTFTVNAAGSPYTVTVKDANNCTATTNTVTVLQPTALTATASSTPVTSNGGSDGTATANPVGGTPPYTYSWSPGGQTTITAIGLTAGSYTVTVTDANSCTTTATTTVGSPACNITASASAPAILCNGGTTTLTVTASGGTGALQYSLNGGAFQAGNTFTVNAAGSPYTVTVKDASNCTATTNTVTVTNPAAITASASAGNILCNGGTTTLTVTASGGTGALQYNLNGGAFQAGNTFTVNVAGSPYTVTVKDANNCTATTNTVTVTNPAAITASASAAVILCNGGTTTLTVTASGGTGALQYSLNGGAFQAGNTFTVNAAGSPYTVTVKDANNCTATTNTITVTNPAAITASASAAVILCNGGITTLIVTASGGTGALQYSLNGGAFQAGNTFTVNAAGSPYTVTVKDANNCTATTNTVTVLQPTALTATASSTPVTSNGGSDGTATASPVGGTPPYTYSWSPGGQTTITATGLTAGSYTVTITDANECTTTATTTVGSPACNITASAAAGNILCNGGTTTLTVIASGGTGALQYSLNGGAFQAGNTFTVGAGIYTVTVRDASLCTVTTNTVTVANPAAITASASAGNILCNGGTTTLTVTASGGTGALQYSLNGGAFQAGNTFTVNAAGSPYTVTVKDANNCTATTNTVTVTNPAAITRSASAGNILCNGGTTTLTVTASGGTGALQYSLNGGAFQAGNTFTVNAAGSPYTVIVKDANNCTATTNTVTVLQPTALTATASSTPVTSNGGSDGTATANPVGGTPPYTYSWSPGGQTTITAMGLTAGSYTVTITDANACTITAATTVSSPGCNITASASASAILCNGGTTTLTVIASGGTGALQYSLNGGAFQAGNTFTVNAAGSPYIVTVKDAGNCTATTNTVTVLQPTTLTATASSTPVTSNGGSDGTATANPGGGTPPYTYSWSPGGQTTITAIGLTAGSYTVTVTDANRCMTTASTIVGTSTCNISATISAGTIACNGGTTTLTVIASGGTGTLQYSLNGGVFQAANMFTVGAGTYTVTVRDANQCAVETNTIIITQPSAALQCTIRSNVNANTIYLGYGPQSATFIVNPVGGTGGYSFSWSTGGTGNSIVVSPGATTTYTVTVTDAAGCTTTCSITITVIDVRCGNKNDKVMVCHNGHAICINRDAVADHLAEGDYLGACTNLFTKTDPVSNKILVSSESIKVYPNPVIADEFKIQFNTDAGNYRVDIIDATGRIVTTKNINISGNKTVEINLKGIMAKGVFVVRVTGKNNKNIFSDKIILQ